MKLQLDQPNNWILKVEESVSAVVINENNHAPIPTFKANAEFNRRVIAVQVTSSEAKNTWKWAGYLNQESSAISNALGISNKTVATRKLWLNQVNLLIFPQHTLDYRISFTVPDWFKNATAKVWEYVGAEIEVTEDLLLEIRQQELQRIESKINDLSTYRG